jgi:hypothetical protein
VPEIEGFLAIEAYRTKEEIMPNYCENVLTVTDQEESGAISAFLELVRGTNKHGKETAFTFHKVIAYPPEFQQMDDDKKVLSKEDYRKNYNTANDGFNSGGYEWCITHWGTKWDLDPEMIGVEQEDDSRVVFSFATAWAPPKPIVEKLAELFPHLRIVLEYWEGSMCFQGHLVCEEGRALVDEAFDYYGDRGG